MYECAGLTLFLTSITFVQASSWVLAGDPPGSFCCFSPPLLPTRPLSPFCERKIPPAHSQRKAKPNICSGAASEAARPTTVPH